MAERLNAPVLKTGDGLVPFKGSNPFPSAHFSRDEPKDCMIRSSRPIPPEEVADHYEDLDRIYREVWGEHVHHGLW